MYHKQEELLSIVLEAGNAVMNIYNSNTLNINKKEDSSPLTDADLASNQIIINGISKFSDFPILSEEGKNIPYDTRKNWEKFWLIDPLDGTKEFISRNGEFTINVALIEKFNNEYVPTLGIVFAPALNKIYWNNDETAFCARTNNQFEIVNSSVEVIQSSNSNDPYKIVGSRSHSGVETEELIKKIKTIYNNVEFISMGSSLKICVVAEGKANIYPRLGPTMEWDIAAAHAICKKAKCEIFKYDDNDFINLNAIIQYNKENLLNPSFIVKIK